MHASNARRLSDELREDARDAFLPATPPRGWRNFGWRGEAPEALRWRGCGGVAQTERLLDALIPALSAPRIAPDLAALARFVEIDLFCAPDDPAYPPVAAPWTPPQRRRLTLASLYGDGPAREPERYDQRPGPMAGLRLAPDAGALRRPGRDPLGAPPSAATRRSGAEGVAAVFARLHTLALGRLASVSDAGVRFAAAQRVTRAIYRDIVLNDLAPRTLRGDVLAACATEPPADLADADADDAPAELSHVALPLWSVAAEGATPAALGAALRLGVSGGVLGVEALCALVAPRLAALPGAARWVAVDGAARARLLADWAARGPLPERPRLRNDPPPLAFLCIESAAPAASGGGDGRRLGALGSALVAEALHACLRASAAEVERARGLRAEIAAVFPMSAPPRSMADLRAALRRVA